MLSRVLASMWRPNGEPDLSLRRANLAALIQSLTPDEANFLKELMNRDPRSGRDPAAKFPVDIWILIADSLGTRDYVSALAVSRQWRSIWSEDAVARKIAMNNYPALLLSTEEPSKSIRDAIVQCHRLAEAQRHGIYKSVVAAKAQFRDEETFRMHPKCLFPVRHTSLQIQGCGHDPVCPVATQDPDDDRYTRLNPDTFLGCAQIVIRYYASGRIAWQSVFCSHDDAFDHEHNRHVNPIIVDELATRARRLYYPRGPDFPCRWVKLAALGDKFVVALSWPHHGSRTVYVAPAGESGPGYVHHDRIPSSNYSYAIQGRMDTGRCLETLPRDTAACITTCVHIWIQGGHDRLGYQPLVPLECRWCHP